MLKKYFYSVLIVLLATLQVWGQKLPERPNPPRLVNNLSKKFPNFISASEQAQLEEKLVKFANETSNQIAIVIIDDLQGDEPWHFATELGEKWKIGQEKEDNGIVILIKPTGGQGQRKYFIAVGRGLEGAIPDLTARRIEEKELVPNFMNNQFYAGLDQTTTVLMALAKGDYNSAKYAKKSKETDPIRLIVVVLFVIIFIVILVKRGGGKGGNGMTMGAAGMFFGGMGGFGGGRSGGGGFGGGSSGGFGGFGGGSFGGGGSGGSW